MPCDEAGCGQLLQLLPRDPPHQSVAIRRPSQFEVGAQSRGNDRPRLRTRDSPHTLGRSVPLAMAPQGFAMRRPRGAEEPTPASTLNICRRSPPGFAAWKRPWRAPSHAACWGGLRMRSPQVLFRGLSFRGVRRIRSPLFQHGVNDSQQFVSPGHGPVHSPFLPGNPTSAYRYVAAPGVYPVTPGRLDQQTAQTPAAIWFEMTVKQGIR